jgi:hypothetical protein
MSEERPDEMPMEQRQTIFRRLVELQDEGLSVSASLAEAARLFEISEQRVKEIEREGLDKQWPPL